MNDLRDLLQLTLDHIDAVALRCDMLRLGTRAPLRLRGLDIIAAYLSTAKHALDAAIAIAARL